jgi:hypothetical protein
MNKRRVIYFTISRFFQRRFLPLHFLHFRAVSALRAPQSRQIFIYNLCFWAIVFFIGSNIGIDCEPSIFVSLDSLVSNIPFVYSCKIGVNYLLNFLNGNIRTCVFNSINCVELLENFIKIFSFHNY